jgi:hypothetical protein
MALTQITTDGIKDGTITGTDLTTNVDLVDNQKLRLGTGNDLQIYHDGSHSYIADTGTGNLNITASTVNINNAANSENIARFIENGAVELYYDNSKKLETNSTGIHIFGNTGHADGAADLYGSSNDLSIFHDGNSRIVNTTNYLTIKSDQFALQNQAGDHDYITVPTANQNVRLHYDNVVKFQTTNTGVTVAGNVVATGNMQINDGNFLNVGNSGDLQIYHDGSNSFIKNSTGGLDLNSDTIHLRNGANSETYARFLANGAAELYFDNTKHIFTESGGGAISGRSRFLGHGQGSGANSTEVHFNSDNSHIGIHFSGHGNTGNTYTAARMVINGTGGTYGTITYSTGGTGYNSQSSDSRSKKNIVEWTESELDNFKNLQPKLFHFDHNEDSDPKYKGYIAQDNIAAFPEAYPLVDDRYMFNPSGMVHYLMKAMQELVSKVEVLETEVAALKAG